MLIIFLLFLFGMALLARALADLGKYFDGIMPGFELCFRMFMSVLMFIATLYAMTTY